MIFHTFWLHSCSFVFFICYYQLIFAAGMANVGKTMRLSTTSTQHNPLSDMAAENYPTNWAFQNTERQTASARESRTSEGTLPSSALRNLRERRGASSRLQFGHKDPWGPRAGTAGYTSVLTLSPSPFDVYRSPNSERPKPGELTESLEQRGTREEEVTAAPFLDNPNQWWLHTGATPVHKPWIHEQPAEGKPAEEAVALPEEQEAASVAGLTRERRTREAGRPHVHHPRSGVQLPVFLAGIAAALVMGGLITGSLMQNLAAAGAARQNMSSTARGRLPSNGNKGTTLTEGDTTPNETGIDELQNEIDAVLDWVTVKTVLTYALPLIILLWSPAAAMLMLLYQVLTSTQPAVDTQVKRLVGASTTLSKRILESINAKR